MKVKEEYRRIGGDNKRGRPRVKEEEEKKGKKRVLRLKGQNETEEKAKRFRGWDTAENEREFGANGVDGNVPACSVGQGGTSSSGNALINPLEGGCIGAIETGRRGFGYNRRLLRRRRGGGHGRVREQGRRQK